ncbi:MAG: hypothetical protein J3T61_05975 [Candidatus Brocadiales bacterium]|nr:hypothetical protein [Candidatus Bathyanammoxibius sp.]
MGQRIVRTREELNKAVEDKADSILVRGELAEKLNTALRIRSASKWAIGLLAASLASIPFTGGLSAVAAAPIAALTGIEIVAIIAVAALGVTLVFMILRDFKKVTFCAKNGDKEAELKLERA